MRSLLIFFILTVQLFSANDWNLHQKEADKAIQKVIQEGIFEEGFVPKEVEIKTKELAENVPAAEGLVNPGFRQEPKCDSYADLTCPVATQGHIVKRGGANLKTGKVNCLVYSTDNLDRALANLTYTNAACSERWKPNTPEMQDNPYIKAISAKAEDEKRALELARSDAKMRADALGDTQLNLSDLLIAVFTMDGDKIDLLRSIQSGEMKLNDNYSSTTENLNTQKGTAKLSDLSMQALNSKVVAVFEFMSKATDTINTAVFILIISFAIAYFIKSGILIRIFDKNEREGKRSEAIIWGAGAIGAIMFFLVPAIDIGLTTDQRIQQSKFHTSLQWFFADAAKLSNKINLAVHDATFSALLKERGYKSTEQIYLAAAENKVLEDLVEKSRAEYTRCTQIYDIEKIKKSIGTANSSVFPLSEEELHKKMALTYGNSNVESPYFSFRNSKNTKSLLEDDVTLSQCGQAERTYREGQLQIAKNHEYLTLGQTKLDDVQRKHVKEAMERQYKAVSDWGFISAAFLPVTLVELELANEAVKLLKDDKITDTDQKDFLDKIVYNVPYLIFPGTGRIVETAMSIGSIADGIPFVSGLAKSAAAISGAMLAVSVVKVLLLILPYLLMSATGLIIGMILFFQIIAYFISGFFAVLLAIWHQNTQSIFGFLGRGVRLFAKIVAFPISMFFALVAHWITTSVGGYLSSTFADNNTTGFWSGIGYQLVGGFLNIAIVMVSIFLAFKIINSLTDMILENLNFKQQDILDQTQEQIQQQAARRMPTRI